MPIKHAKTSAIADGEDDTLIQGSDWNADHVGSSEDYILLQDQKSQNTNSGTFTSGDWRTRDLNTEVVDTGNHASIASNQITLEAGTYRVFIKCPASLSDRHQARLQNITDNTTVLLGTSEASSAAHGFNTSSFIIGRFTIAAQKVLEVQHRCQTSVSNNGFGYSSNFTTEVFTVAEFWREG